MLCGTGNDTDLPLVVVDTSEVYPTKNGPSFLFRRGRFIWQFGGAGGYCPHVREKSNKYVYKFVL